MKYFLFTWCSLASYLVCRSFFFGLILEPFPISWNVSPNHWLQCRLTENHLSEQQNKVRKRFNLWRAMSDSRVNSIQKRAKHQLLILPSSPYLSGGTEPKSKILDALHSLLFCDFISLSLCPWILLLFITSQYQIDCVGVSWMKYEIQLFFSWLLQPPTLMVLTWKARARKTLLLNERKC